MLNVGIQKYQVYQASMYACTEADYNCWKGVGVKEACTILQSHKAYVPYRVTPLVQELTLSFVPSAFPSRTASLQSFMDHVHYTSELVSFDGSFSGANQPYAGMGVTYQA